MLFRSVALAKIKSTKAILRQALDCIDAYNLAPTPAPAFLTDLIADIPEPIIKFWWFNDSQGTVTVGGEKRQFEVISLYGERPLVRILSSKGDWIDSRWKTSNNNRYIKALIEVGVPQKRDELYQRAMQSAAPATNCYKQLSNLNDWELIFNSTDDQPPGRGDGRGGRVESEWVEELVATDWTNTEF